jgi:2-hydroxychromene-2-carboxylate isomerase
MRCATWARQQGRLAVFARTVLRREFAEGADIADLDVLLAAGVDAGLDAEALNRAAQSPDVKQVLRQATDVAWEAGVRGVPTIRIGGLLFYGDDQLELAAGALREP